MTCCVGILTKFAKDAMHKGRILAALSFPILARESSITGSYAQLSFFYINEEGDSDNFVLKRISKKQCFCAF